MAIRKNTIKRYLESHKFGELFNQLGWDWPANDIPYPAQLGSETYHLRPVAQKRGFIAYHCPSIPDSGTRSKIETKLSRDVREHIIIFTDLESKEQIWQWVRRVPGQPLSRKEHKYQRNQPMLLIEKIGYLEVGIDEEENIDLIDVFDKVRSAFDIDRVTKRFYDRFKKEHDAFHQLIKGISDLGDARWYTSVMLNRLMFIYFIQKKGFLDGDENYLSNRLAQVQALKGNDQFHTFYRYFLLALCHEVLAKKKEERQIDEELAALIGDVPYLNGGVFQEHEIEKTYGDAIAIPDEAFKQVFDFFDQYEWHLDNRPDAEPNEINPDVLGYIFEKYINQKQMGAYYTKEDITEYISKNTIIPCLFDKAQESCKIAFEGETSVWNHLQDDPDRYIYPAVRHGITYDVHKEIELAEPVPYPEEIADGLDTSEPDLLERRKHWNTPTSPEAGLPTEIWRETVARQQRYEEIRGTLARGEVRSINDLITLNLDIRQFAQDVIERCESPDLLNAFWVAIAGRMPQKSDEHIKPGITVLDPTCGSGAFLFAALTTLEPLYEACLDRMRGFLAEWDSSIAVPAVKSSTESSTGVPPVNQSSTAVSPVNSNTESSTAVSAVNSSTESSIAVSAVKSNNTGETPMLLSTGETPVLRYFNPYDDLSISSRNLPHWEQDNALYFITFRLADALPAKKLDQWKREKEQWLEQHPEPWEESDWQEYAELFPERLNRWLDAGSGSCLLSRREVRDIVEQSLRHFDGERYRIFDYVIMPNHVHVLVQPLPGKKLSKILHGWKSFTAHAINKELNREGTLWQNESYDHLVRSEAQMNHYRNYIAENPVKAKLHENAYTLKSSIGVPPVNPSTESSIAVSAVNPSTESSIAVSAVNKNNTGETPMLLSTGETPMLLTNTGETPMLLYKHRRYAAFFQSVLDEIGTHTSPKYFVYKSIIVNNLFGVDIMKEAVEICKLRLFLKLVAQVEDGSKIEPLPDIDFNIKAGNTLVGFATEEEMKAYFDRDSDNQMLLQFDTRLDDVKQSAEAIDDLYNLFRQAQLEGDQSLGTAKANLSSKLDHLNAQLNEYLADDYGIDHTKPKKYAAFLQSHQPFHWFIEFYGIMKPGGFDAIIGNPPFVENTKSKVNYSIRGYKTLNCGNLYAFVSERSLALLSGSGYFAFIMPSASISTPRMHLLTQAFSLNFTNGWVSLWDERPSKLFDGVDQQLSIHVYCKRGLLSNINITSMRHWTSIERHYVFDLIRYCQISTSKTFADVYPKTETSTDVNLLNKLTETSHSLVGKLVSGKHTCPIYYRNAGGRYWRLVKSFPTYFRSDAGAMLSTTEKVLFVPETIANFLVSALSSTTFYWFWRATSNCRHLTDRELSAFPIPNTLLEGKSKLTLETLAIEYEKRLNECKNRLVTNNKRSGKVVQDTYNISRSKPIIDEIDKVLAEHYGFTEEELDYIINYDIKYRMGQDL